MITGGQFSYFSLKPYIVTPHLNCLVKKVQMRGQNIGFCAKLTKIIPNYHQILVISAIYVEVLCIFLAHLSTKCSW